ncbi:hypothetical protein ACF0H5_010716 [Mactra antiquata]
MVTSNKFIIPAVKFSDDDNESQSFVLSNPKAVGTTVTMEVDVNGTLVSNASVPVNAASVFAAPFADAQPEWYLNGTEIANKSMTFESNDNIGLYVIGTTVDHTEGFTAIPTDSLGREYYVSTFCDLGGYCQIAIATVETGITQIYIELPVDVNEVSMCIGRRTWVGADRSFNLMYPESVQIESAHDLTGTYIYSDKDISVVAGTRSMPVDNPAKIVYFYEHFAPVPTWGTEFFLQGRGSDFGSIIHITAADPHTFVDMTGYRTTKMDAGNTIRRRLEKDVVAYLKASKAVQVVMYTGITYNSPVAMDYVSMTIVPAVEHYQTSYTGACGTSGTTSKMQYATKIGNTSPMTTTVETTIDVPLTSYKVVTATTTSSSSSSSFSAYGGIMYCNNAMFPMAPPVNTVPFCTQSLPVFTNGDGINNDCQYGIDGDVCYENVKVTTKFVVESDGFISSYTKNVSFYQMLLRIQSCDLTQVELRLNETHEYVLHIYQAGILVYECSPQCSMIGNITDTKMSPSDNCSSVVKSYWITEYQQKLCVNVGHYNPNGNCNSENLIMNSGVFQIRLSGLTGDAVFWYGSPDHYGRMFVFVPPPVEILDLYSFQALIVAGSDVNSSNIGIDTDNAYIETHNMIVEAYEPLFLNATIADVTNVRETIYIFAETDVTVSYVYNDESYDFVQPIDALGTEYMTIDFTNDGLNNGLTCVFARVYPNTIFSYFTDFSYGQQSDSFTETFQNTDKTGSVITGNQPFSAWCGTGNQSTYGVTWYQLPPTNTWGTFYLVPSLGNNVPLSLKSKVRVVTNSNSTAFTISGDFDGIYELNARGDFEEFDLDPKNITRIESNFPVAVAAIYYDEMDPTKSSVHFIPPTESFADDPLVMFNFLPTVTWTSVTSSSNVTNMAEEFTQYYNDTEHTFYYYQSNGTSNSFLYSYRQSPDSFAITHSTYLFKDLTMGNICNLQADAIGDGIDNDCDGVIDEETTCITGYATKKTDIDLDGNFGEDCVSETAGVEWAKAPQQQQCEHVESTDFACSVWCQCKCSWQDNLARYNNMTEAEKAEYNEAQVAPLKEAMKIDKSSLSSTIAEKESADDERQSSQSIGVVGVLLIVLVLLFICAFDFVTLFQKVRSRLSKNTNVENVSS